MEKMKERAKQKAEELFEKYQDVAERYWAHSLGFLHPEYSGKLLRENKRRCALIAVDLKLEGTIWADPSLVERNPDEYYLEDTEEFWEEVKNALNNM